MKKHVKDLKYLDVVHIQSLEEHNKISKYHPDTKSYEKDYKYYLIGAGGGHAQDRVSYSNQMYAIYEFSNIEFPIEISTELKVGDRVRCIGEYCSNGGWQKGLEFTIKYFTQGGSKQIAWGGLYGGGVYLENLELVSIEKTKELTSLPERWTILCSTPEIIKVVRTWYDEYSKQPNLYKTTNIGEWISQNYGWGKANNATEITLEQFKKWVLKENIPIKEENKPVSPMENEDWCVIVTTENRETIKEWMGDSNKGMAFSTGAYYGMEIGIKHGHSKKWKNPITTEEFYKKIGKYDMEPKKEENLVGRWVKAVVNYPSAGTVRKGEYGKIIRYSDDSVISVDFPSQQSYSIDVFSLKDKNLYELMPEGFVPAAASTFQIGDKIEFLDNNYYSDRTSTGIPKNLVIHGSIPIKGNNGIITSVWGEYFIVEYSNNGKIMRMGFLPSSLKKTGTEIPNSPSPLIKDAIFKSSSPEYDKQLSEALDSYSSFDGELLPLQEEGGLMDFHVKRSKTIKKELVEQEEGVILF